MFCTVGRHVPPPQGVQPAVAWGSQERVAALLGPLCTDLRTTQETCAWRFSLRPGLPGLLPHLVRPDRRGFQRVGEQGRAGLESELVELFESHQTATDGTLALDVAYLQVVGVRS